MKKNETDARTDRRSFLKLAGVAAGGAILAGGATAAQSAEQAASETGSYRESEHVKTYYKLARF